VFTKARHWNLSWASWIQFTPSIPISLRSILMLSSHVRYVLPVVSYLRASRPKPCKYLSPSPCMPHVPPTTPKQYSVKNIGYEAHHYAFFSTILFPPF
jgi:hypothetical protein